MFQHIKIDKELYMSKYLRSVVFLTILIAFSFGFMEIITGINFERFHIFLFNLSVGGFTILYFTENRGVPSFAVVSFYILSLFFAVFAFFEIYEAAIILSFFHGIIVEFIRIKHFSFFPWDFFKIRSDVTKKFHHASLLCLSIALFLSGVVILNDQFYHWIDFEKLKLNVFFLGFSFPVTLITLSVIFSFVKRSVKFSVQLIEHVLFWVINLGVILFFIFIIFDLIILKVLSAVILFVAVLMVFIFFIKNSVNLQQKHFLVSGIYFLLSTAVTGIAYIVLKKFPLEYDRWGEIILSTHAYLALYGWNLSGLFVIIRWNDFPIQLNSFFIIGFHWIVISIFSPLGKKSPLIAFIAIILFAIMLVLFISGKKIVNKVSI